MGFFSDGDQFNPALPQFLRRPFRDPAVRDHGYQYYPIDSAVDGFVRDFEELCGAGMTMAGV